MSSGTAVSAAIKEDYIVPEPDEEEQLLAKFVFGDTSDFHSNLKGFDIGILDEEEQEGYFNGDSDRSDEEAETENMEQVQDDQLFFVDDGTGEDAEMKDVSESEESGEESSEDDDSDAWYDSDDETLNVPIVVSNRSKKLRSSYSESSIRGKEYIHRLRTQFEKIYPRPKWVDDVSDDEAQNDSEDGGQDDDEGDQVINGDVRALSKILETTYNYKDNSAKKLLPSKSLNITRLKDANVSHPSQSAIQSLSFHPLKPLLLTGGYDRTLRIYHIDSKSNPLVSSVYLKGTPIQTCKFYVSLAPSNSKSRRDEQQRIYSGGRRRYMHSWDLSTSVIQSASNDGSLAKIDKFSRLYGHEDTQRSFENFKLAHYYNFSTNQTHGLILLQGNNGWINILNAVTGVWMMGCKINGILVDFCLDYKPLPRGKFQTILIVANTYSEVWEFNLNDNGKVIRKWKDDGGVGVTKIQVGGGTNSEQLLPGSSNIIRPNRWLAIGSESGYVNIYDRAAFSANPKPVASLDQLTTTVSTLQFSPDGQILCMASRAIKDALRLVHLPTCTVFSNWPTSGTPLGKVTAATFSPRGELLAVGNEQGKVRLWRLNHF